MSNVVLRLTAMTTEYLLINDSCQGQAVETIRESLPQLNVVATLAWKKCMTNIPTLPPEPKVQSLQTRGTHFVVNTISCCAINPM